jgi:hypothetical protein
VKRRFAFVERFGLTDNQVPLVFHNLIESIDQRFNRRLIEIDHHIAAKYGKELDFE